MTTVVRLDAAREGARAGRRREELRLLRKQFEDCVSLRAQVHGTDYTKALVEFLVTDLGSAAYQTIYGDFMRVERVTIETMAKKEVDMTAVSDDAVMRKRAEKRGTIEQLMEEGARSIAKLEGVAYEVAYAKFLHTDLGRQAYAELHELSIDTERTSTFPVEVARLEGSAASATLAKAQSIDARLDEMAEARSARTGESIEKAFAKVLLSDEGRRLYAEQCELMASVRG